MKFMKLAMLVLVLAMAVGRAVAMLPPETFKDPIFAFQNASESEESDGGYSEFA